MSPNYQSQILSLYYRDQLMGVITNPSTDQPWFMGDLAPTEAFEPFREGFDFMASEEYSLSDDPPIDVENWFIEDDQGERVEALVQISNGGKDIYWRW